MGIRRKTDTPEAKEFWDFVDRTAESVEKNFPPWKIGGHKMTKLTNDEINQMAAELLGIDLEHKAAMYPCDFIHDANAVRELVDAAAKIDPELQGVKIAGAFEEVTSDYLRSGEHKPFSTLRLIYEALAASPKHITLAVLYAVGKITLEQAREAMKVPDSSEALVCRVNPVLSRSCQLGTKSCSVDHNQNCEAMEGDGDGGR